jgi:hypothetical protein
MEIQRCSYCHCGDGCCKTTPLQLPGRSFKGTMCALSICQPNSTTVRTTFNNHARLKAPGPLKTVTNPYQHHSKQKNRRWVLQGPHTHQATTA